MKKLTLKEKQLVKEYAKKLVGKRSINESSEYDEVYENPIIKKLSDFFKELVPPSGAAETIEGEMIRAMNRIVYRCYNDGDVIGKGYGRETVSPSAKWLSSRPELRGITSIFNKATAAARREDKYDYDTISYMRELQPAIKLVVDYVESKNGKYTPNNGDDSR